MRKVSRQPLPSRASQFLERKQTRVISGADVTKEWTAARRTVALRTVVCTLKAMIGKRSRCYFCGDSRGTDVEHFWPKVKFPARAFRWCNFLLACAGCNRQKGEKFPLDQYGNPLLIDPTTDDPWDHLFYDTMTGRIAPRWRIDYDDQDPKGRATCNDDILPLNIEAISESRRKATRDLARVVQNFLSQAQSGNISDAVEQLKRGIRDHDDHGLSSWFFERDGQGQPPFSNLRKQYPEIWKDLSSFFS